jgi:cyclohexa-1,5-dienecarbonyl-CoA hydratase
VSNPETLETAFQFLTLVNDGQVARIVLRRPPLNVLDLETIRELNRALRDLRSDTALRALVLQAEGKAFSAGVSVQEHLPETVGPLLGAFHDVFRNLVRLSVPTIAAVQGPALGGGCELACFADLVIASEAASFGVPEIKLASFPPVAAVWFPHRIGASRTLRLILSGDVLPAREAERIGLVDQVVAPEALAGAVDAAVARFLQKSAPALRLAKRAMMGALGRDFENGLNAAETLFLEDLMKTGDAVEGLRAFLEKRPPAWRHS